MDSSVAQVPDSSVDGQWHLRVEGREGLGASFKRVANLTFTAKFLNILIQPSRPVYNAGQTGEPQPGRARKAARGSGPSTIAFIR